MSEILELDTRAFDLETIGRCEYLLSLTRDEEVYQVAVFNVTDARPVFLCGERERFVTTRQDETYWFWRSIRGVRV